MSQLLQSEHDVLKGDGSAQFRDSGSSFCRTKITLLIVLTTSAALVLLASSVSGGRRERKESKSVLQSLLDLDIVPLDQQPPNYEVNRRSVSLGTCVGHVIDGSTWTANLGLKVAAAIQECDPNNFAKPENIPDGNGFVVASDPALLPAFCTRSIFTIARDVDQVGDFMTGAAQTCKPMKKNQTACARSIEGAVFAGTNIGRFGAELRIDCDQAVIAASGFFACADRLEALAWNVDALASAISRAASTCAPPSQLPTHFGAGACTGEITAAAAYIASGSLYLTSAVGTNCKSLQPEQLAQKTPQELQALQARCARDNLAFVRMLGLAGTMAAEAAGHCGNLNTDCGASIGYAATALSGAGQASAQMAQFCNPPTECCVVNPITFKFECNCNEAQQALFAQQRFQYASQCARFTASMVKLLAVTAGMATQANAQCKGQQLATNTCGTMVSSAIAGFGFLTENIARTTVDCKKQDGQLFDFFGCGQRIGFIGDSIDTSSRTIGAAVANCGFGNIRARADPIPLRRRFYVP